MKAMEEVRLQLVEGIRVRQEALNALSRVEGVLAELRDEARPGAVKAEGPAPKVNHGTRGINGRGGVGKRWSKGRQAPYEACRKLAEPFGAKELAKAAGITEKGASSQVYRWAGQGLLTKVSPGVWKRSAKFPGGEGENGNGNGQMVDSKAPERVTEGPSLKSSRESQLRLEISALCGERDRARGKGLERIAQTYQNKIDTLEKELEAVQG